MSVREKHFLEEHAPRAEKKNIISNYEYTKYNAKRGLRNEDGTGVLIGLTEIGEVHGYILVDREKIPVDGRLLYRGIDIKDIVDGFQKDKRFGFEEVIYLLLFGDLPNASELEEFRHLLAEKRELPSGFTEDMVLRAPSADIMNKLARSTLVSYSYDPTPEDQSVKNVLRQSVELIARFPAMAAYAYQAKRHYFNDESLYIHAPQPELSAAENLLQMIRPDKSYTPLEAEMLDLALSLHAEHGGGNNSAFTIHVVSSAGTDTYSAVAAAVGSLKGSKHGGANAKVMSMVDNIKKHVSDWSNKEELRAYLLRIIQKKVFDRSGLIYGMGHAVYTLSDPRAILLRAKAEDLAKEKGLEDELDLYNSIAELTPEVFEEAKGVKRVIAPNVDFYSGFVYKMLNIPPELYTPIFAVARVAGWCSHRIEEIVSGGKIIRPAYKNVLGRRSYTPLQDR